MSVERVIERPLLALELSQRQGGVAVIDADGVEHVRMVAGGRRDRDDFLPAIDSVCSAAGIRPRDLTSVAVNLGPGGFTGLRVSIAAAQAIAETAGATVVGVPAADVAIASTLAGEASELVGEVAVIAATRNGSGWQSHFTRGASSSNWRMKGMPGLRESPTTDVDGVLADEHLMEDWRAAFEDAGIPVIEPRFDPAALARLALHASPTSERIDLVVDSDPATLRPIYPRVPEAVRLWQERDRV
ncbi:MAG: tRNA (adenosine(37)-N6)-threonylcarbamoyltransferase complex dimerization subunit type 1 TsaB [Planctomycetaceae bacterium]|nr:tRNA (adenosine(37)-N6)-threonylcarbamoyltransferase complex dimerization subunit type 1 TsaB [Planctomycetaceae bacterium]